MAKIVVTFAEIKASVSLAAVIIESVGENFGGLAEKAERQLADACKLQAMNRFEMREYIEERLSTVERKLISVDACSVTIEVPEQFIVGYLSKCERFAIKAAPILAAMANLAKSFAMVFKAFEKDLVKLVRETFGSSDKE